MKHRNKIAIKETVRKLDGYAVPRDFSRVKLNQNESPFDVPPELKEEISKRLLKIQWNRYPDNLGESLIRKISDYTGFPATGIVVGNSSNELIQTVIYSLCDTGDHIVVTNPGFPMYKRIASIMNIGVKEVPLRGDFDFDVNAIIARSNEHRAQLVILASPNNPTGAALPAADISAIAENIEGILVVDEAYYEFYKQSARNLVDQHKNIIIIRTFSKAFNLAGIRLGYMLGRDEFIKELSKSRLPFSVGMFQQLVGEIVMENRGFVETNVAKIIKERDALIKALKTIPGIRPFPSYANFILFQSEKIPARDLFAALFRKGVVLRFYDTPELQSCLRVTIGTGKENRFFLEMLKEAVEDGEVSEVSKVSEVS